MNENRISLLVLIVGVVICFSAMSSCATADHKAHSAKVAHKRHGTPKNYSIYSANNIDYKLLRKGQKAMSGPALDQY